MKKYRLQDFRDDSAWLVFRVDTQVGNQAVDIYMLMDLPSGLILAHELVPDTLSDEQARVMLDMATKGQDPPRRILLAKGDPAGAAFLKAAEGLQMVLETPPASYLDGLVAPVRESIGSDIFSPSSIAYAGLKDDVDAMDRESARHLVPDSYDSCSCASGKKFKFCCKLVFREIMGAMTAAEAGNKAEALDWIAKAKEIVGETAEILCREAIVYSYFQPEKAEALLKKSLSVNPLHPRAHYIRGILLGEQKDLAGSAKAYELAIANYPKTDRYHLNEALTNLGSAYYNMGDFERAKNAWEQALIALESDKAVRENLIEFIYENPLVPASLREISPFVRAFFDKKAV